MKDLLGEVPNAYLVLAAGEHIVYSPSVSGEITSGPKATLEARTAIAAMTGLVFAAYQAKEATNLAQSWRNYRVAASAAMFNFTTGYFGYLNGYNVKPEPGKATVNLHAEQVAIAKGRFHGLNRLIGIAIFADPFDEDANPTGTTTLRPCQRCREMFMQAPEVDERTLVLGVNPDFSRCELYTVGSLTRQEQDQPILTSTPFSLQTEQDLDNYDRFVQPHLIAAIYSLYNVKVF